MQLNVRPMRRTKLHESRYSISCNKQNTNHSFSKRPNHKRTTIHKKLQEHNFVPLTLQQPHEGQYGHPILQLVMHLAVKPLTSENPNIQQALSFEYIPVLICHILNMEFTGIGIVPYEPQAEELRPFMRRKLLTWLRQFTSSNKVKDTFRQSVWIDRLLATHCV